MTDYFVDARSGSDNNNGLSQTKALKTLPAVNALQLSPGDRVLFAAGTTYHGTLEIGSSGRHERPIVYGKFGTGEPPRLEGGDVGIRGSKAGYIAIRDLEISHTVGNAIYAGGAHHWTLDNLVIEDSGSASKAGSISFQNANAIKISGSELSGIHGDGIWMQKVHGVLLENNKITDSLGHDADAIQINDAAQVIIRDNSLSMTKTDSAKGVVVLVRTNQAVVERNAITGGGFGIAAYGQDITIRNNDIARFGGYSWSYGIGLGAHTDAKNYRVEQNFVHEGTWGISISSPGSDTFRREGIEVYENVFSKLSAAALKVDRPATGSFHNNAISTGTKLNYLDARQVESTAFRIFGNEIVPDPEHRAAAIVPSASRAVEAETLDPITTKSIPQISHDTTQSPEARSASFPLPTVSQASCGNHAASGLAKPSAASEGPRRLPSSDLSFLFRDALAKPDVACMLVARPASACAAPSMAETRVPVQDYDVHCAHF